MQAAHAIAESAGPDSAAIKSARRLWHDTVACTWSGYRVAEVAALRELHADLAPRRFMPPGGTTGLVAPAGAVVNSVAACWDEACEGLAVAHGRPGVPVISALWALAFHRHLSWNELLRATVFGYQVGGSMAAYLRILPGMHVDAVWPALGVAAAVAWALDWSEEQRLDAVETCASQLGASLYPPVAQGMASRNTYLGHSAWLGMSAALSSAAGVPNPRGAAREYARRVLQRPVDEGPAPYAQALVEQAYWKPFACVRHVQYGARAAQLLRPQLSLPSVDAIRLKVYPEAIVYCGNRAPLTTIAAQFSLSHGVAAMLAAGALGPAQLGADALDDPQVRRLEAMVDLQADPDRFGPGGRVARLEVRCAGQWHTQDVGAIEGDAGLPPTAEQRQAKFAQYCGGAAAALAAGERILHAPLARDASLVLEITP